MGVSYRFYAMTIQYNIRHQLYHFMLSKFLYTLEHFYAKKKGYFISFYFIYNIHLYPLAWEQHCVFNLLIAYIPLIFEFHAFGKF